MTSNHADLLNALHEMQKLMAYAMRRETLAEAERLIASQEQEIDRLTDKERRAREAATYLMTCIHGAADRGGWSRDDIATLATMCRRQWPEFFPGASQ